MLNLNKFLKFLLKKYFQIFRYIFEVFRVNNAVFKMSAGTKDYLNNFIDHINVKSVGARKRTN